MADADGKIVHGPPLGGKKRGRAKKPEEPAVQIATDNFEPFLNEIHELNDQLAEAAATLKPKRARKAALAKAFVEFAEQEELQSLGPTADGRCVLRFVEKAHKPTMMAVLGDAVARAIRVTGKPTPSTEEIKESAKVIREERKEMAIKLKIVDPVAEQEKVASKIRKEMEKAGVTQAELGHVGQPLALEDGELPPPPNAKPVQL